MLALIRKIEDKSAFFIVIYFCWRNSFLPMPLPNLAHYIIVTAFAFFTTLKGVTIQHKTMFFLLCAALSNIIGNPDPIFRSWERWLIFILLILMIGPLNKSRYSCIFKEKVFKYMLYGCIFMSVGSLVAYISGNGMFYHGHGYFKGLYNHSMTLGPMAAISAVFTFQQFLTDEIKYRRKYWLVLAILSVLMCMLASSRTAFVAMCLAVFILLLATYKGRRNKMLGIVFVSGILMTFTYPIWSSFTDGIRNKMAEQDLANNSRTELWKERIEEFKDAPIFGQGFAAFDLNISYNSYNLDTGGVEPGSSWLFVLSSLGCVGFILFLLLVIPPTLNLLQSSKTKPDSVAITILCVSIIFMVHMLSEGYILSAGSSECFFVWLCFALIQENTLKANNLYVKKWIEI